MSFGRKPAPKAEPQAATLPVVETATVARAMTKHELEAAADALGFVLVGRDWLDDVKRRATYR